MRVPLCTTDFLHRAEVAHGARTAVVDEPGAEGTLGTLTYTELAARARGLAARLDDLGIPVGGRVGFVSPNGARFLIALYATGMSGRILVPINFRLQAAE